MNLTKHVIDTGLSGLTLTEEARARLVREVIGKEKNAKKARPRANLRRGVLLVAALTLILGAVAFAAQMTGYMDWTGRFVAQDVSPLPTASPATNASGQPDWDASALIQSVPDGEYWAAEFEGGSKGKYGQIGSRMRDMEELATRLGTLPLKLPRVPDGCTVTFIEPTYDTLFFPTEADSPYETSRHGGLTLKKYRLPEESAWALEGYCVTFADADGRRIVIDARLLRAKDYEEPTRGEFLVTENMTSEPLTVPGFDRAIIMTVLETGARQFFLQQDIAGQTLIADYGVWMQGQTTVDIGALFGES